MSLFSRRFGPFRYVRRVGWWALLLYVLVWPALFVVAGLIWGFTVPLVVLGLLVLGAIVPKLKPTKSVKGGKY